ncbi:PTS transporter subunit EIIC [Lactiplantibacillus sp. WILCCON 0030]|uniref:Permease IIC component n=1 Tax=Lactiplantibacillus brownii TaxID=3069269 RepID=A0ABU1A7P0_9LACO|nr:PTS transporter subunit EIIC [Lactiplantibacillus brownii]MDQ7936939.1 PTS transporter subunit EIIC [Lactiplantibacillus brownii]
MSRIKQVANQLLKWEDWINHQRYFHALRSTLTLLFPFVLIGAFINIFNQAIFQRNGFLNHIYYLSHWLPGFKTMTLYTTLLSLTVNGLIAVVAAFTAANFAVRSLRRDNLLAGLTAALSFCLLNFNYAAFTKNNQTDSAQFLMGNLGSQGIFLALLVGLVTGWLFNHLAFKPHTHQLVETRRHLLSRAKDNWLPMGVSLGGFSVLSYGIGLISKNGLNGLFYSVFRLPFANPGSVLLMIISVTFLSNFFWLIGIIGPIDFSGNSSVSTVQNLEYALQHGSAWGAPNPITLHTVFDSFANVGGPGMTLALVIAILWRSHNQDFRTVAKASWLPSLFNFNQPLLVGLPIMFSPILAVPFLLAPLASLLITWTALKLQLMPPVVYPVGRTMPGFLMGWLGTGGDWRALAVSLVNLAVATVIYLPFVLLENRVVEGGATDAA